MTQTLLVELLTEELPPKALAKLGDAFANGILTSLKEQDFLDANAQAAAYATPRRLAVTITHVRDVSPDQVIHTKVLPVSVALDAQGQPTAPLTKKLGALAEKIGIEAIHIDQLVREQDGKAESFFFSYTAKGVALKEGLQTALDKVITQLPIPKVMSYQLHHGRAKGETVHFVRPAHALIALYGQDIVPVTVLGLDAGSTTLGHRFLSQGEITISSPEMYVTTLIEEGKVVPSFTERKEKSVLIY